MKKNNDDIPLLTESRIMNAPTLSQRQPKKHPINTRKSSINLNVDPDICKWLKKSGPELPQRVNRLLREIMEISEVSHSK